jgi:hypothetical protein
MPNAQRKYRWDRITLVGGTFLLLVFSLVAWMAPDTAAAEGGLSLEHPGEEANRDSSLPVSSDQRSREHPQESTVRSEVSSHATSNGASAEVEEVKPCSCNRHVLKLPKNPYTDHQVAARNLPNSFFVKDKNEMEAGKRRGDLVPVHDNRGYHITALSHSYAVLLPEVQALLAEMGNAFADELEGTGSEGTRFRVTSLTRTERQQARLGRRNYNAFNGRPRTAMARRFDIAYADRPSNESDCSAPTRAIQNVLRSFQKRGVFW